jgi:hypothetical protein
MAILKAFFAAVLSAVLGYFRDRQRDAEIKASGAAEATLKSLEENNARVDKALAARRAAAATGMRDDDPYLRD